MTSYCFISVLGPACHHSCPVVELIPSKTCCLTFLELFFSLEAIQQGQKWLWMPEEVYGTDLVRSPYQLLGDVSVLHSITQIRWKYNLEYILLMNSHSEAGLTVATFIIYCSITTIKTIILILLLALVTWYSCISLLYMHTLVVNKSLQPWQSTLTIFLILISHATFFFFFKNYFVVNLYFSVLIFPFSVATVRDSVPNPGNRHTCPNCQNVDSDLWYLWSTCTTLSIRRLTECSSLFVNWVLIIFVGPCL